MFEALCSLPLQADLFAQSVHPSAPILAVGLSSGHVQTFQLPVSHSDHDTSIASEAKSELSDGRGEIETLWKTRRHKGSCRAVEFSYDGAELVSAGTDGLVKGARSEDGRVVWKLATPVRSDADQPDPPVLLHCLSPQTLLLGTDLSALYVYDLRDLRSFGASATKPHATYYPHDDFISSLTPLPPTEASTSGIPKQWISTGDSTLALTDLRKGVVRRSEDQEEELLSSTYITGLSARGTSTGAKAVVGDASGVITLWESGVWDDQDERIVVDRGERSTGGGDSLEVMAQVPEAVAAGKMVAVGLSGGTIRLVKLGPNKVVHTFVHDEVEGVLAIDFDLDGRMISGGGQIVKVWGEKLDESDGPEDVEADEKASKRGRDGSDGSGDDDDDSDEADSSEDEKPRKKRKKRKRSRGKDVNGKVATFSFKGLD